MGNKQHKNALGEKRQCPFGFEEFDSIIDILICVFYMNVIIIIIWIKICRVTNDENACDCDWWLKQIEITCRGQQLVPFLTLQHVRDNIWSPRDAVTLLPETSTTDHVMVLHYARTASNWMLLVLSLPF